MSEELKREKKRRNTDHLLMVLYVLLKYTNESHKLQKKQIINKVNEHFDLDTPISRNACNNALEQIRALIIKGDTPLGIFNYGTRNCSDRLTNMYMEHLIKDHELRFIMDMISSCEYIPLKERQNLLERLCCLSSEHIYSDYKSYVRKKADTSAVMRTEFDSKMKIIHKAIHDGVQITFNRISRMPDKKFSYETDNGKKKEYTANPYRTIFNDGFYYLVCGISKGEKNPEYISNYRIDRMDNVSLTKRRVFPETDIPGVPKNSDTLKYISTHRMMWSGKLQKFRFRSVDWGITEIVDFFGDDFRLIKQNKDEGTIIVEVETTENNMKVFARRFVDFIDIIYPTELRKQMKKELYERYNKYCEEVKY